jgi:hypothetical protein
MSQQIWFNRGLDLVEGSGSGINLLCKIIGSREGFTAMRANIGLLLRVCSDVPGYMLIFHGPVENIQESFLTSLNARGA